MRILALVATAVLALFGAPAVAQTYVRETVVVGWEEGAASRFVSPALAGAESRALAAYGPFRVIDANRAALVGVTDSWSPAEFAAMLEDWPGIDTLEFVECPGTYDDRANLRLGRMIRRHGLAAVVPHGGSVRSGAVELFLAGVSRSIADDAEFAVHAWLDDAGMSAWDYAADSPEHRKYLAYYQEMGMDAGAAARFYAMTNSVPFESALWLSGSEMRGWINTPAKPAPRVELPRLAYLDLNLSLN